MANVRMSRINAEIQKRIAEIVTNKINNPDIDDMIVSVTRVDTAPDLETCKVYISILGSDEQRKKCFDAIVKSAGYIRRELSPTCRGGRLNQI
jgi:ribosome-binding factor A